MEHNECVGKHPLNQQILTQLDEFLCKSENARTKVALLLDYDGTLSPIAPRPELATLPEETRKGKKYILFLLSVGVLEKTNA